MLFFVRRPRRRCGTIHPLVWRFDYCLTGGTPPDKSADLPNHLFAWQNQRNNKRQKAYKASKQRSNMKLITTILVVGVVSASPSFAGTIERACIQSDRSASRSLCNCIQRVADVKLSRSDQKLAAKFFDDPHLAQETRQSDSSSKERFWKRYKAFGQTASRSCS
jgi:hypothetical protein